MNEQTTLRSSFRDFLTVIFKWKFQIALVFIVTVGTIVGITYSIEPTYQAQAQIIVKLGSRSAYTLPGSTDERSNLGSRTGPLNTEKEFLRSRFLAEKVIDYLGSQNIYPKKQSDDGESPWYTKGLIPKSAIDSVKNLIFNKSAPESAKMETTETSTLDEKVLTLQNNISIRGVGNTNIIEISFKHSNPEMAAKVVNTYIDIYLDERLKFRRNVESRTFFKNQALELQNRLEVAENNLEEFKNNNNITDLEHQQRLLLQQISNLRVAFNNTLSEEIETESRITLIAEQLSKTPETIPQDQQTDQNELLISRMEAKLVDLQIEEKELLSKYTPQSRMVRNVRERIEIVESKIKEQENKLFQRNRFGVNTTYQRLKEALFRDQAELEALKVKKGVLEKQLAEFEIEKENLNRMETKLHNLQQSVDLYRGNHNLYLAKLEASRIEDAMDTEKINEVVSMDRALPPLKPISPKYKFNTFLSILLGVTGGLLWAIIRDLMNDSLETPEDVEKSLNLVVLTSIPDTISRKRLDHRKVNTMQSNLKISIP